MEVEPWRGLWGDSFWQEDSTIKKCVLTDSIRLLIIMNNSINFMKNRFSQPGNSLQPCQQLEHVEAYPDNWRLHDSVLFFHHLGKH